MSFETDLVLERGGPGAGLPGGGKPGGRPIARPVRPGETRRGARRRTRRGHRRDGGRDPPLAGHCAVSGISRADLPREHQEALRRASAVAVAEAAHTAVSEDDFFRPTPEIRVARRAPRATPNRASSAAGEGTPASSPGGGVHGGISRRKLRDDVLRDLRELVEGLQVHAEDADRGPQAEVVARVAGGNENPTIAGERRNELAVQGVRLLLALRARFVADHNVTVRAPAERRCFLSGPALPTDRGPPHALAQAGYPPVRSSPRGR